MSITRLRVKETFTPTLVASRRRETFVTGELIAMNALLTP